MSRADERGWGPGWPNCNPAAQVRISAGGVIVTCRKEIAPLVKAALDESRATGYVIKQEQTGAYVCRPIGGTSTPSNHSWGLAIDVNWNENPFTRDANAKRSITPAVVSIFKKHGFSWGGDWSNKKDFMHMEYIGTPNGAAAQVLRIKAGQPPGETNNPAPSSPNHCSEVHPTIKAGAKGKPVNHLQYFLIRSGAHIPGDGDFGPRTRQALKDHQTWLRDYKKLAITPDGICGPKTWQAMHDWADGLRV